MNRKSSASGKRDLRPLALFLFALCILSVAAARMAGLADHLGGQVPAPQQLAWREGSLAPGLYREQAGSAIPAGEKQPQVSQASANPPARMAPLFFQPIPVNQADAELLATIPGIGPAFARRIIEFRDQHGRINAIEELDAVPGIGPAKLTILKAHLVVD